MKKYFNFCKYNKKKKILITFLILNNTDIINKEVGNTNKTKNIYEHTKKK